ncbi:MAG: MarR family transcriptional regulator [Ignavibacteriaceae bacterium]|nr:MarR family transcriptional regulator [Ignavibacteriaceae bacterium]
MTEEIILKREMIQRFGDAYKAFGLNKLMGNVVALLLFSHQPLSLDELCSELGRSKGPVSQIVRRLRDRKLIRKVWDTENSRKDYYEIEPEIFENAFLNNFSLIKNNTKIAGMLKKKADTSDHQHIEIVQKRLLEMEAFYMLMEKHFSNFLNEWELKSREYR